MTASSRPFSEQSPERLNLCIYGVYGKGNLGDEALLLGICDEIRSRTPGAAVTAFCSDPESVRQTLGISAVYRSPTPNFLKKLRLLRAADVLIIGGGTLVCDHAGAIADLRALGSFFFWPIFAKLFGVPAIAYAQGLGPARHGIVRWSIRHLLSRFDGITFRDARSAELMAKIVGGRRTWMATVDPVVSCSLFLPERVSAQAGESTRAFIRENAPYTALCLRYPKEGPLGGKTDYYRRCAKLLAAFHREAGSPIVLFPAHVSDRHKDDRLSFPGLREALTQHGVPSRQVIEASWTTLEDGAAIVQNARLAVGDRLHPLLLAAMAGVPVTGLSIEDKIRGCLEMIGLGPACAVLEPGSITSPAAVATLLGAWNVKSEKRLGLSAATRRWATAHAGNLDMLLAVLRR